MANHPFIARGLNVRDENGNYGCAHCGWPESVHPAAGPMSASTADGTLKIRTCTCSFTWGVNDLGHVTEIRRPGANCPTHPVFP